MSSRSSQRRLPNVAEPAVVKTAVEGGAFVLTASQPLAPHAASIGAWLARWAKERPDGVALAERAAHGNAWRRLTWQQAYDEGRAIGQAFTDRGLSLERPVMVLSANSIDHALVSFGAFFAGVPVVPTSVAYSLRSKDYAHLRDIAEMVTPGVVFAEDGTAFARAIHALESNDTEIVTTRGKPEGVRHSPLDALRSTHPGSSLEEASQHVGAETVAKILMTSGSTGKPKGVLNTHGMLTANQESLVQVWPFVEQSPPVLVDWLPWSHTFGGNHNFNLVLRTGGTLHIDEGRPAPGLFDATVRNLAEVSPTVLFNVPAGYAMLVQALEREQALRRNLFARLEAIFYAGAALPQATWDRLDRIAENELGERLWLTTAWGSTETAPLVTSAHFPSEDAANIGVPVPGCELKFTPAGAKLALSVRGPNVTPGYHRAPELTAAVFDDEGYYRIGDAGRLVDESDPSQGVRFDGRVSEDFKLHTGTWVNVGKLRTDLLSAAAGLLSNAVVCGHDREYVAVLAWIDPGHAASIAGGEQDPRVLATHPAIHDALRERLANHNATAGGSSRRIARVLLLTEPPSLDDGEITDKGYVNADAVLRHRPAAVDKVYSEPAPGNCVTLD